MAPVDLPSATANTVDPDRWADATCRALLAIQAQNRQLSTEERAEAVEQHLRERLTSVADSQRRACLHALAARFPLPEFKAGAVKESEALTPGAWVTAFDSIKGGLTPELQEALLEKLKDAGYLPQPGSAGVAGIPLPGKIESLLPKEPGDPHRVAAFDPVRVTELIDVIVEATLALDGNFRRVWEGLAEFGKTDHGLSRHSFEEVMRKFLMGDEEVPRVVLKTHAENTAKLIPAVLMAVKQSWDGMEADVAHCLPEEIQKRVKKTYTGYDTACWKEYTKSAEKLQPDPRVQEFFEQIVTKALARMRR